MVPADSDWGRDVFYHHECPAAHIPAIDLQQKGCRIAPGFKSDPVIKDTAVAAMDPFQDRIA
jgi:hypothetical protein